MLIEHKLQKLKDHTKFAQMFLFLDAKKNPATMITTKATGIESEDQSVFG